MYVLNYGKIPYLKVMCAFWAQRKQFLLDCLFPNKCTLWEDPPRDAHSVGRHQDTTLSPLMDFWVWLGTDSNP